MDEELTASSPKMLFVSAVQSVSTTEASDKIDVNSRAFCPDKRKKHAWFFLPLL